MADSSSPRNFNSLQLLQELEALSESLYPPTSGVDDDVLVKNEGLTDRKPQSRRMSLSYWRSRLKLDDNGDDDYYREDQKKIEVTKADTSDQKSGFLSYYWRKPIRALSRIGKKKLSCLFSVEVVAVRGLPASMNGLRVAVCVRKKETRNGAVQTMPARVSSQGAADFEETLFIRCHVYFNTAKTQMQLEPRPFLIYLFSIDAAEELNFGRASVDLSQLIQESVEKSFEGRGVSQWERRFNMTGKAQGGELVLKFGFQIMETEGNIGIYSQALKNGGRSSSFARRQSKTSFSVPSKRMAIPDHNSETEDLDIPDFEVVDKGVEIHDQFYLTRLEVLDSIAQQIKALESILGDETDEETVTREFIQMLEDSSSDITNQIKVNNRHQETLEISGNKESAEAVILPDLGKRLGCVVRTRNGGYLVSMNPLKTKVAKTDTPKLAMQMSKPFVLPFSSDMPMHGIELFQGMAASGLEEMSFEIFTLMPMDELAGKTAEQIAFEGIASEIIQGIHKDSAKSMANAININTGRRNVTILTAADILSFSLQKTQEMAVEALKIQADMAEELPAFDVSAYTVKTFSDNLPLLAHAVPLEEWAKLDKSTETSMAICVILQLRDPLRQYEAVGGPMIALIQATSVDMKPGNHDGERMFKVAGLHVGGLRVKGGGKENVWDTEKQRVSAMQWLIECGVGKKMKKKGESEARKVEDLLWSISSGMIADMWLKPVRNPDVKFTK